jgi:endonuclease/exonuclease/phosphatase family metal-dependent hydrolase
MDRVKVVTLNLWGGEPPLERRLAIVAEALRALTPDVVALQEVRAIPSRLPNTAETLAKSLGYGSAYALATKWGGGEEGLALLSPHPLSDPRHRELPHATDTERRIILGATVSTPAGELHAFTTHLNYRLHHGQIREDQVVAAEQLVAEAPDTLPRIWMGDFNAIPDADEIRYLRGLRSVNGRRVFYQDAFAQLHPHEPGDTWSSRNPFTERLKWLALDRRIDYIFVSANCRDGRGRVRDCRILFDQPDGDGCFASDHFGLYAEVQVRPFVTVG